MKTIICHSFPAWDAPYVKSTIELMGRLAQANRVIYIDYHYTWKDVFRNPHCPNDNVLGRKSRWRTVATPHGDIEIYSTPPILPMNWINDEWLFKNVSKINGWWIRRHLAKAFKNINRSETVMLNALNPVFGVLTDKLWKAKQRIYYCYDELTGTNWSNKWGPLFEKKYLKIVDKVICTSTKLQKDKSTVNSKCYVVKNGVNLDLFKNPTIDKTQYNSIGYIGAVDDRIDFSLVKSIATEFPGHLLHFYGPVKIDLPTHLPTNICFHGSKVQEELPELIKKLDVCIIPFVKNDLTAAIYPLKINEYLAMGKPVVTTNFSDLSDFSHISSIADNQEDFALFIKRELTGNSRLRIQKRIDYVQNNSWSNRSERLEELLKVH